MMNTTKSNEVSLTAYKQVFNKHRRRPDDPSYIDDIEDIVDFSNPESDSRIINLTRKSHTQDHKCIDSIQYDGPMFGLESHPGFVYIPSALAANLQRDFVFHAVTEFCELPHGTNIDLVPIKDDIERENLTADEMMWELWKKLNTEKYCNGASSDFTSKELKKESEDDYSTKKRYYRNFDKLSWATLGYRFDWTARSYKEKNKSEMPDILNKLGNFFSKLGEEVNPNSTPDSINNYSFTASAAIVNYYSLKSSMGGHRDDSELDMTKPVVSLSLGLPAVFMIGGKTRNEGPVVPLLLRPGDVMLLGGDSRLNFHGIARILSEKVSLPGVGTHIGNKKINDFQINSWNTIYNDDVVDLQAPTYEYEPIRKFLQHYRVNANVRQVLPDGIHSIPEEDT